MGSGDRGRSNVDRSRGMGFNLRGGGTQHVGSGRPPNLSKSVTSGESDKQNDEHIANKLAEASGMSDPSSSGKFVLAAMEVELTITCGS